MFSKDAELVVELLVRASIATAIREIEVLGDNIVLNSETEILLCEDCEKESYRCYNGGHTRCLGGMVLFPFNFCRFSSIEVGW